MTAPAPSRWRARNAVVEARQLVDDLRNHAAVAAWVEANGGHAEIPFAEPVLYVETPQGRACAGIGDWVIKGVTGLFFVRTGGVFRADYEPADAAPAREAATCQPGSNWQQLAAPAPEAATPPVASAAGLPKFLGHPDDLCEQWIAETWEPDPQASWDREDMQSAYREGRDEARRQLAPAWDALAAERDAYRKRAGELMDRLGAEVERDELREERDALAAQLTQAEAERDKLDKALEAFHRLNASRERSLYAALIDVWHHDGGNAAEILAEAVDGYDGPQWDGTETGLQWLERTRGASDAG